MGNKGVLTFYPNINETLVCYNSMKAIEQYVLCVTV